jgi:hypothetical protein
MFNDLMSPINVRLYTTTIESVNELTVTNFIPAPDEYY